MKTNTCEILYSQAKINRKQKMDTIKHWRIYTMRKKSYKSFQLQALMADIHRNIYLKNRYFQNWLTAFRIKTQQTKIESNTLTKPDHIIVDYNQDVRFATIPNLRDAVKHRSPSQIGRSLANSYVMKANITHNNSPASLTNTQNVNSQKTVLSRNSRNQFSQKSMMSSSSDATLKTDTITTAVAASDYPQNVNIDLNKVDTKFTCNDDCSSDCISLPLSLYYFSRKWRYFHPLKKMFYVWKYVAEKRGAKRRKRKLSKKCNNKLPKSKKIMQ